MLASSFASRRIAWSRALFVAVMLIVLFTTPPALDPPWLSELSEVLGFFLLASACLWRIWCALFIAGNKDGELSLTGPYSVMRNPLYVGNFFGLVGFGLAVQHPPLAVALGLVFALFYPSVVVKEEKRLAEIFGERYREYCARVPRWVPNWTLYQEPATVTVAPRHMRNAILDAMWFLWAFALWEFIEELHKLKLLPRLF